MNREQAINYLFSCGFTNEQVGEVVRALTYEPTTKNDLGVDCISREQALVAIRNLYPGMPRVDFSGSLRKWVDKYKPYIECDDAIKQLPSVTPQPTKNDLGVDLISRADAIQAMQDKAKKLTNEDTINGLCGAVAILFELPSVTPQLSVPEVTALAEWTEKLTKASEVAYNKGYADGRKEQESKWIPVKTINQCYIPELKDYHGKVIATYLTGKHIKPQVTTISISYGRIENKKYTDIVAVMYLPEPYSEVQE